MAKQVDFQLSPGVTVNDSYWIVGELILRPFDRTGEVVMYGYASEAVRRDAKLADNAPIQRIRYFIYYDDYMEFFSAEALSEQDSNPVRAAYNFVSSRPVPGSHLRPFSGAGDV